MRAVTVVARDRAEMTSQHRNGTFHLIKLGNKQVLLASVMWMIVLLVDPLSVVGHLSEDILHNQQNSLNLSEPLSEVATSSTPLPSLLQIII